MIAENFFLYRRARTNRAQGLLDLVAELVGDGLEQSWIIVLGLREVGARAVIGGPAADAPVDGKGYFLLKVDPLSQILGERARRAGKQFLPCLPEFIQQAAVFLALQVDIGQVEEVEGIEPLPKLGQRIPGGSSVNHPGQVLLARQGFGKIAQVSFVFQHVLKDRVFCSPAGLGQVAFFPGKQLQGRLQGTENKSGGNVGRMCGRLNLGQRLLPEMQLLLEFGPGGDRQVAVPDFGQDQGTGQDAIPALRLRQFLFLWKTVRDQALKTRSPAGLLGFQCRQIMNVGGILQGRQAAEQKTNLNKVQHLLQGGDMFFLLRSGCRRQEFSPGEGTAQVKDRGVFLIEEGSGYRHTVLREGLNEQPRGLACPRDCFPAVVGANGLEPSTSRM